MKRFLFLSILFCLLSSFTPKRITWIAIGDSITYLNDHKKETGDRITKGYMTLVTEKLTDIDYINQGHNGWTSGNIADEIDNLKLTKADVYSVFLGTNDWWTGRPLGTFSDYENNTGNKTVNGSFRIIVNKLRSLNPNATIILITPMQRLDFVYIKRPSINGHGSYKDKNGQMLSQFADAINKIGAFEHFKVIDLYHCRALKLGKLMKFKRLKDPKTGVYTNYPYPKWINIPFNPETDEYPYPIESIGMTYDGLHPSDKGYKVIAKRLVKVLKKL